MKKIILTLILFVYTVSTYAQDAYIKRYNSSNAFISAPFICMILSKVCKENKESKMCKDYKKACEYLTKKAPMIASLTIYK